MRILPPVAALTFLAGQALALDTSITKSAIAFSDQNSNSISVSISGPDGFNTTQTFDGDYISFNVSQINQGADGVYNYDVVAVTTVGEEFVQAENGRQGGSKPVVETESTTGHFRLENGNFVLSAEETN